MSEGAQKLAAMVPVDDVRTAATLWSELLGVEPTFVDGNRWAQFDVAGTRLALAGTDRDSELPGVMVKVADVAAARARAEALSLDVGALVEGPHETRCNAITPGGWLVIFYATRA